MEKALRHDLKITNLMIFIDALYWLCVCVCVYAVVIFMVMCVCVCVCVSTAMVVCERVCSGVLAT